MQRSHKLLAIGSIVVLLGFSAVLAVQTHREPGSANDQTRQPGAPDARVAEVAQGEPQQMATPGTDVAVDRSTTAQTNMQDLSTRAKAKPKDPLAPEHLAAHRAEERVLVRREYAPLFEMLKLSSQQEEAFIEVLVEDGIAEPTNVAEWRANRAKRRQEQLDKLTAIVGYDKAPLLEEYQRNMAEYTRVTQIAMQLDAAGSPLSKEQKRYLAQLMIAERDRIPQPSTQKAITTTADIDREVEWMADQDRRIREGAASMLSPTQVNYLDEVLAARFARRRVELYRIPVIG